MSRICCTAVFYGNKLLSDSKVIISVKTKMCEQRIYISSRVVIVYNLSD